MLRLFFYVSGCSVKAFQSNPDKDLADFSVWSPWCYPYWLSRNKNYSLPPPASSGIFPIADEVRSCPLNITTKMQKNSKEKLYEGLQNGLDGSDRLFILLSSFWTWVFKACYRTYCLSLPYLYSIMRV